MKTILRSLLRADDASCRGTSVRGCASRAPFATIDDVIEAHFSAHSSPDHPCRPTLAAALDHLGKRPANILETGSSAWGTNSTLLLDAYVASFGGELATVDIRPQPMRTLQAQCSPHTTLHCDDSVAFLKATAKEQSGRRIDLIYLDSWDVDWTDPLPSAIHGFHEFLAVLPWLKTCEGALLLVDDTPADRTIMQKVQPANEADFVTFQTAYGLPPGKGCLIKDYLANHGIGRQIAHTYQLLWAF
jgi:hypothetical protein